MTENSELRTLCSPPSFLLSFPSLILSCSLTLSLSPSLSRVSSHHQTSRMRLASRTQASHEPRPDLPHASIKPLLCLSQASPNFLTSRTQATRKSSQASLMPLASISQVSGKTFGMPLKFHSGFSLASFKPLSSLYQVSHKPRSALTHASDSLSQPRHKPLSLLRRTFSQPLS